MSVFLRKVKYVLKKFEKKIKRINLLLFYFFKVDDKKIIFINFNGRGYGCNPKYIAEEIIKRNLDCNMIWLVNNIDETMPKNIKQVKYASIRAYYEMATAKIWISNTRNDKFAIKKKNQFYIQTWHSSLMGKLVEGEAEECISKEYINEAKRDGKITDLMISDNDVSTYTFKNFFWYDGEILNIGLPRNDIIFNTPENIRNKVYEKLSIPKNKKIILYSPTFRENFNIDLIKFDYEKIISIIEEKFNDDFVIVIKLHPNIVRYAKDIDFNDKVINGTYYSDNQELIAVASIGISDYSSVQFELGITNKPVFLLCKDYFEYHNNERGIRYSANELPFPCALTEQELEDNIKIFNMDKYIIKCNEFFEKINFIKNDNASKVIVDIIKNKIEGDD